MATGDRHTLNDGKLKAVFLEDAVYGLVVESITDLASGKVVSPAAGPLFRITLRDFSSEGVFTDLEPSVSGFVQTADIIRTDDATFPSHGPQETVGPLTTIKWEGTFSNVAGSTADLHVVVSFSTMTFPTGRLVCDVAYAWTSIDGGVPLCVYWVTPCILAVPPLLDDHYLAAIRSGVVSRAPQVDLASGTGKFQSGCAWEPELYSYAPIDRFEAVYPESMSTPLTAYGSRKTCQVLMLHGDLSFEPTRVRDWFDGTNFVFEHSVLQIGVGEEFNSFDGNPVDDDEYVRVRRYFQHWVTTADYLGEACGERFHYWLKNSFEGQGLIAANPADTTDRLLHVNSPVALSFNQADLEEQFGFSDNVVAEVLEALPFLTEVPLLIRAQIAWWQNDAISDPAGFPELPDLFSVHHDAAKKTWAATISAAGASLFGEVQIRRPQEWDPRQIWSNNEDWGGQESDDAGGRKIRSGIRMTNSVSLFRQMNNDARPTTHAYNTCHCDLVAGTMSYDSGTGETTFEVTVGASPAFDPLIHSVYTKSFINVGAGEEFLGICVNEGGGGIPGGVALLVRGSQAEWVSRTMRLKGNHTGTGTGIFDDGVGTESEILLLYGLGYYTEPQANFWEQYAWMIGHDAANNTTAEDVYNVDLCPLADTFSNSAYSYPTDNKGPQPQLIEDLAAEIQYAGNPYRGLMVLGDIKPRLCCFESIHIHSTDGVGAGVGNKMTFAHRPGDPSIVDAHRSFLAFLRAQGAAETSDGAYHIIDSHGPYDWQVGITDGHARADWVNDFATTGSWGGSQFFWFAFGSMHAGGLYRNWRGFGHIQGGPFLPFWEAEHDVRSAAMVADFLFSRKPITIYAVPSSPGGVNENTNKSGGADSWTPFFDLESGMHVEGSGGNLIAKLSQLYDYFDGVPLKARRARSLSPLGSPPSGISYTAPSAPSEGHSLSPFEEGDERPSLIHACYAHPTSPGKFIAVFVNESSADRRGGSYRFKASEYRGNAPWGGYTVTQHVFSHEGVTSESWDDRGVEDIVLALSLDAGSVVAFEFQFNKSAQFTYRYDGQTETKLPIDTAQDRLTIEDIHGSGERFQFGLETVIPGEPMKVSSLAMRVHGLGQSSKR